MRSFFDFERISGPGRTRAFPQGSRLAFPQDVADLLDRLPVAGGGTHFEVLFHGLVGINKSGSLTSPETEGESAGDADDPHLPLVVGGLANRKLRWLLRSVRHNCDKSARALV